MLHRYGDRATFFIITSLVGKPRHLTWPQLEVMSALGEDLAAHGVQHDDLSLMPAAEQAAQIDGSLRLLREKLHVAAASYCYPSGRFNRETLDLVRRAGVDLAVTTDPKYVIGPENRFEMPRIRVRGEWSLPAFAAALRGASERARIVRRDSVI